jgi:hypothetical protein
MRSLLQFNGLAGSMISRFHAAVAMNDHASVNDHRGRTQINEYPCWSV